MKFFSALRVQSSACGSVDSRAPPEPVQDTSVYPELFIRETSSEFLLSFQGSISGVPFQFTTAIMQLRAVSTRDLLGLQAAHLLDVPTADSDYGSPDYAAEIL
jgi:hypothetical protein